MEPDISQTYYICAKTYTQMSTYQLIICHIITGKDTSPYHSHGTDEETESTRSQ